MQSRGLYRLLPIAGFLLLTAPAVALSPTSFLPGTNTVPGWVRMGPIKVYNSRTLYNLIDGEADAVKQYTFLSAADARYVPHGLGSQSITVDIYDMENPLNAFGLFSQDRQGAQAINVGAEACKTAGGTGISLWRGRYLVRLAATAQTPEFLHAMLLFAKKIAARLPGAVDPPALLRTLPAGAKQGTEQYIRENVAGHSFVRNAVTARYPSAGPFASLFVAEYPSPTVARSAYLKYSAYERSNGRIVPLKGIGQAGFFVLDRFAHDVVIAYKGRYLVGALRAGTQIAAEHLVKEAMSRIP